MSKGKNFARRHWKKQKSDTLKNPQHHATFNPEVSKQMSRQGSAKVLGFSPQQISQFRQGYGKLPAGKVARMEREQILQQLSTVFDSDIVNYHGEYFTAGELKKRIQKEMH